MSRYHHPAMKEFADQQARYAHSDRKLEQLSRAESLLAEVEDSRQYPYQYVCYRITDFRPETYPDLLLDGAMLRDDLRQFIDDLSASANLSVDAVGEPILTVEEVSKQFNISTKTVNRWRERGLVSRRFLVDGRKRVGFLKSSIERFVQAHRDEVDRGVRFSQLSDEERDEILDQARRLARVPGMTLAEASRRLARSMQRSPETIRYTIKNYDRDHPATALFPNLRGPLDAAAKQKIHNAYRRGHSIEAIADSYGRTRSSIYRVINEVRAQQILSEPLDYMYHESFDGPEIENVVAAPEPEGESRATVPAPAGLPPYLQALYQVPLLTREQEQYLFRKMNYLLHLASKLREDLVPERAKPSTLDEIERLRDEALDIKRRLIRANLRLVVSIAKRHVAGNINLFELISDGNVSLMRAVEKFDFSRGFKFSTYASWAIMKNFARSIPAEHNRLDRFQTGQDLAFEMKADDRPTEYEVELARGRVESAVDRILNKLDERERQIIIDRYGLSDEGGPQTLEQVGNKFGVTKERIRQIEARAISKLRQFASEDKLDQSFFN